MLQSPHSESISRSTSTSTQRTQSVSDPGVSNVNCHWSCDICGLMCKSLHEFCEDPCCSGKRPARNSRRWYM